MRRLKKKFNGFSQRFLMNDCEFCSKRKGFIYYRMHLNTLDYSDFIICNIQIQEEALAKQTFIESRNLAEIVHTYIRSTSLVGIKK